MDLQPLAGPLRSVATLLAVVRSVGVQILHRSEAVEAACQCASRCSRRAAQLALLVLKLDVQAQVGHRIVGMGRLAAFVAHDAASQLTVKGSVEEALALRLVALGVARGARME